MLSPCFEYAVVQPLTVLPLCAMALRHWPSLRGAVPEIRAMAACSTATLPRTQLTISFVLSAVHFVELVASPAVIGIGMLSFQLAAAMQCVAWFMAALFVAGEMQQGHRRHRLLSAWWLLQLVVTMLALGAHSQSHTMADSTWHDFLTALAGAAVICEVGLVVAEVARSMSVEEVGGNDKQYRVLAEHSADHGRAAARGFDVAADDRAGCGSWLAHACPRAWRCPLLPCCAGERVVSMHTAADALLPPDRDTFAEHRHTRDSAAVYSRLARASVGTQDAGDGAQQPDVAQPGRQLTNSDDREDYDAPLELKKATGSVVVGSANVRGGAEPAAESGNTGNPWSTGAAAHIGEGEDVASSAVIEAEASGAGDEAGAAVESDTCGSGSPSLATLQAQRGALLERRPDAVDEPSMVDWEQELHALDEQIAAAAAAAESVPSDAMDRHEPSTHPPEPQQEPASPPAALATGKPACGESSTDDDSDGSDLDDVLLRRNNLDLTPKKATLAPRTPPRMALAFAQSLPPPTFNSTELEHWASQVHTALCQRGTFCTKVQMGDELCCFSGASVLDWFQQQPPEFNHHAEPLAICEQLVNRNMVVRYMADPVSGHTGSRHEQSSFDGIMAAQSFVADTESLYFVPSMQHTAATAGILDGGGAEGAIVPPSQQAPTVSIPDYGVGTSAQGHKTVYRCLVEVKTDKGYVVSKRYSDFKANHDQLKALFPKEALPPLPVGTWRQVKSDRAKEERRAALELYLLALSDPSMSQAVRAFLFKEFLARDIVSH